MTLLINKFTDQKIAFVKPYTLMFIQEIWSSSGL